MVRCVFKSRAVKSCAQTKFLVGQELTLGAFKRLGMAMTRSSIHH
jgi:hypothetical protein